MPDEKNPQPSAKIPAPPKPITPSVDPFTMIQELPPGTFKKSDQGLWERRDNQRRDNPDE
jgi:hypothetical protein